MRRRTNSVSCSIGWSVEKRSPSRATARRSRVLFPQRAEAHAALRRIRERAEQLKFGAFDWSEWKAFRDEGRP